MTQYYQPATRYFLARISLFLKLKYPGTCSRLLLSLLNPPFSYPDHLHLLSYSFLLPLHRVP
jgi:hypothetical protein